MHRLLLPLLVALFVPAVAAAAPAPAKAGKPNIVDMPILVAPLTQEGRLIGYAYLNPEVTAASSGAVLRVRDRTPFLQDAFIRDVNGASIQDPANPKKLDVPALTARLLADAKRVVGAGSVTAMGFGQIQMAPLIPAAGSAPATPVAAH